MTAARDNMDPLKLFDQPAQPKKRATPPGHDGRVDVLSLDREALDEFVASQGERPFRAQQIFRWLHQKGAASFDEMTNLKKDLREKLEQVAVLAQPRITDVKVSADGTRKYQLETHDGHVIESVYIPHASGPDKNALCISSQVGCAMGCRFCATASLGIVRHLSPGEIVGQYHAVNRDLEAAGFVSRIGSGPNRVITNIVYMGMGEPLHNYDGVVGSVKLFRHEDGPGLAGRRITVSTSGLVPAIEKLGHDTGVHIAISLNATTDAVRTEIMPVNKKYNLKALLDACRAFPLEKRRRITFEYVMLKDVNDSDDDARRLAQLLKGLKTKVNLIPFNAHPLSPYARPSNNRVAAFQRILDDAHLSTFVRTTRGDDIDAACGMLGAKKLELARQQQAPAQGAAS